MAPQTLAPQSGTCPSETVVYIPAGGQTRPSPYRRLIESRFTNHLVKRGEKVVDRAAAFQTGSAGHAEVMNVSRLEQVTRHRIGVSNSAVIMKALSYCVPGDGQALASLALHPIPQFSC